MTIKQIVYVSEKSWKNWLETTPGDIRSLKEEMKELIELEYADFDFGLEIPDKAERMYYDAKWLEEDENHKLPGLSIEVSDTKYRPR